MSIEIPFERSGVVAPGLPILAPGTERHPVPGGGSRAVPLFAGDEVTVLNREGLQRGEMVVFGPDRSSDARMLGGRATGAPSGSSRRWRGAMRPASAC